MTEVGRLLARIKQFDIRFHSNMRTWLCFLTSNIMGNSFPWIVFDPQMKWIEKTNFHHFYIDRIHKLIWTSDSTIGIQLNSNKQVTLIQNIDIQNFNIFLDERTNERKSNVLIGFIVTSSNLLRFLPDFFWIFLFVRCLCKLEISDMVGSKWTLQPTIVVEGSSQHIDCVAFLIIAYCQIAKHFGFLTITLCKLKSIMLVSFSAIFV